MTEKRIAIVLSIICTLAMFIPISLNYTEFSEGIKCMGKIPETTKITIRHCHGTRMSISCLGETSETNLTTITADQMVILIVLIFAFLDFTMLKKSFYFLITI